MHFDAAIETTIENASSKLGSHAVLSEQKTAITSVMKCWTVCLPTGSGRVAGQVTLITLSGNLKDDTELLWL